MPDEKHRELSRVMSATIRRMNAATLEHAQSRMRREKQTQAKGDVTAERSATSDLMTVKEAAAYLRISTWAIYDLTRQQVFRISGLVAIVWLLAGCGKVQTTRVLAERWEIGQHRTCLFGHENIYCAEPSDWEEFARSSSKVTHYVTPYMIETEREELMKSAPNFDGGTYRAKFSTSPMDYSIWDCYKTGTANPAILCNLTQKPTQQEAIDYQKTEKDEETHDQLLQKAHDYLYGLTVESLVQACGQGERKTYGYNDSNLSLKYRASEFDFLSLGQGRWTIYEISQTAPEFRLWKTGSSNEEALAIVQDLPCLAARLRQ